MIRYVPCSQLPLHLHYFSIRIGFPKCNHFFKEFDSFKALEAGYQVTFQKIFTSNVANDRIVPS